MQFLSFLPSLIGLTSGLIGGNQQAQQNAQTQQRINGLQDQQNGAINSMLGYIPRCSRRWAHTATSPTP